MQFPILLQHLATPPKQLDYHVTTSDFGYIVTVWTMSDTNEPCLCSLFITDQVSQVEALILEQWGEITLKALTDIPDEKPLQTFVEGSAVNFNPIPVAVFGTNFQYQVWEALLSIPFATTCTYQDIANQLNQAEITPLIREAIEQNPMANLIPCHRVLDNDGHFDSDCWKAIHKQKLLDWEASYIS